MLLLGGITILGLVGICLLALDKIVVRPLRQLQTYAADVAKGDLDSVLALNLRNEIGSLADNLRAMVGSLKGKIAEADEKSERAQEASERAAKATEAAEAARAAAERARAEGMLQAASKLEGVVDTVTTASEELSAQVEQASHDRRRHGSCGHLWRGPA